MAAPRPIPTALKIAAGNPGKRPLNLDEPIPVDREPVPPEWFSAEQSEAFAMLAGRLRDIGLLSETHTEALTQASMRWVEIKTLDIFLRANGRTYETVTASGDTMIRPRPEVLMLDAAQRHMQKLLVEFGLTPSAATKVKTTATKPKANPFAALKKSAAA